jgi:plastocyanin
MEHTEGNSTMKGRIGVAITLILGGVLPCLPCVDGAQAQPPAKVGTAKPGINTPAPSGNVEGVILFRGEIPKARTPDDAGVRRDLLQVDRENDGLRYTVVWVATDKSRAKESGSRATPPAETLLQPALMDQRGQEFVPRVLAVRSGQPVKFTNSDPANHNVRTSSFQPTNEFNIFTGVDGSYIHRFAADSQNRPVRVGCDIHPWMRGWIYIFDQPHFAVTGLEGRFRIASLSPGEHLLAIRQPDIGYAGEKKVTVKAGETTRVEIELSTKDVRAR